jgi:YD repeat-containing protein
MVAIVGGNGLGTLTGSGAVNGEQGTFGNAATGNNKEAAYVNVLTGNLSLQDTDDFLASHGVNVELTRTYNSQGTLSKDFGAGDGTTIGTKWQYGTARKVTLTGTPNVAGSKVTRTAADGSVSTFAYDATQKYWTSEGDGVYQHITYNTANGEMTFTVVDEATDKANTYEVYDSSGRLVRVFDKDMSGNEVVRQRYIYDNSGGINQGKLIQVTDASGVSGVAGTGTADATGAKDAQGNYIANDQTHFDYDPVTGNLMRIRSVLSDGSTFIRTRYGYDAQNRLQTVTLDLTPEDGSIADGKVYTTTYEYDPLSKEVSRISQSDGTSTSYTYQLVGGSYRVATFTDALNRTTSIDYTTANKPVVTDPMGNKTTFTFAATSGNLLQIDGPNVNAVVGGVVKSVPQSTKFTYDANNNLITIVDPSGSTNTLSNYSLGMAQTYIDSAGDSIATYRDVANANSNSYGKLTQQIRNTLLSATWPAGGFYDNHHIYDAAGRLHYTSAADGGLTEYQYNSTGEVQSELHYNVGTVPYNASEATIATLLAGTTIDKTNVSRTDYQYDGRGLLVKATHFAKVNATTLAGILDGTQGYTYYTHDQAGQLLSTTDGDGNQTLYAYDGLGRQLSRTDPQKTVTLSVYDDSHSKLTVTTTALGASAPISMVSYARDAAGQLIALQQQYGTQVAAATYAYDKKGQLRMSTSATGQTTYWLYDDGGRKIAQIEQNGKLTEYTYNLSNQLIKTTGYATAVSTAGLVDAQGKPASVSLDTLRPAANAADRPTWNSYDKVGKLIATVDANGYLTRYTYDAQQRLVQTTYRANPLADMSKLDTQGIAAGYTGEANAAADRTTRVLYTTTLMTGQLDALGFLTEYKYDNGGRLIDTIRYDTVSPAANLAAGTLVDLRPNPVSPADRHERRFYNGRDQLVGIVDADNFLTEFTYDAAGNVATRRSYAVAVTTPTGKDMASIGKAVNAQDRLTTYSYNALGLVDTETSLTGAYTKYRYDASGNVVTVEHGTTGVAEMTSASRYDGAGHLTAQLNAEGAARLAALGANPAAAAVAALWATYAQTYSYNDAGQRIGMTDVKGNRTLYFYDAMGRLTHTVNPLGEVQEQRYDLFGQVVKTIQYGKRLDAVTLSGLTGGKTGTAFNNIMLALADISTDRGAVFYYDNDGLLSYSIDGAGDVKGISYNAFGQTKATMVYTGMLSAATVRTLTGGQLDNQLSAQGGAGDAAAKALDAVIANVTGAERTVFYYDADGHLAYTVDALGNVSGHQYGVGGKLSAETTLQYGAQLAPAALIGAQTEIATFVTANAANALNSVQQYTYNRRGLVADIADAKTGGNHTLFAYNGFGDIVKQTASGTAALPATDAAVQTIYNPDGRVQATVDATGAVTAYQYDSAGHVIDQVRYANVLAGYKTSTDIAKTYTDALAAGTLSDPLRDNHQRFVYTNGQLVATLSAQQVTSALNGQGQKVYTSSWAVVTQAYDANGRLVQRTAYASPMTNVTGLAPDGATVLTWAAAAAALTLSAPQNAAVAHDASTRMVYDAAGRLLATATAQRHANNTIEWAVERLEYDAAGNVLTRTAYATPVKALAPTDLDILGAASSPQDAVTSYRYDGQNRAILTATAQGPSAGGANPPTVQQWAVATVAYDSAGNVVSRTQYATMLRTDVLPADPLSYVPLTVQDRTTRYVYDAVNRLVVTVDAAGGVSKLVYDTKGNVIQRIAFAVPAANPAAVTVAYGATLTAADRVGRTVYDLQNHPVYDIDALGQVTEHRYDVQGNVVATVQYANPISAANLANITAATTPALAKAMIPAGAGADRLERYVYDQDGRLRYTVDAAGYLTETVYTTQGQVAETRQYMQPKTFADPLDTTLVDAEAQRQRTAGSVGIVKYTYDASGNLATATDSQAVPATESYKYDALGHKTSYTNKAGSTWSYDYDAAGHLVLETSPQVAAYGPNFGIAMGGWTDGEQMAMLTRMEYDALGNLTKRTVGAATGTQHVTEYRYDNLGRQTQTILPSINIYNDAADPKSSTGAAGAYEQASGSRISTVAYNAFGDAVSNTDVGGQVSYKVYDELGRVRFDVDALGYVTGYDRDRYGNVTLLTRYNAKPVALAGGKTPAQASDDEFAATLVRDANTDRSIRTAYDMLDRVTRVSEPIVSLFDGNSTGTSASISAGKVTDTLYTTFGEVKEQLTYGASAAGVRVANGADTRFYYDQRGRKIQQLSFLNYTTAGTGIGSGYLTTFSYNYDAVANLSTVTQTEYSDLMTWTASGPATAPAINARKENRTVLSAYDKNNLLVSEIRYFVVTDNQAALNAQMTSYGYDALGRQTTVTDALGGTSYTYFDALGRTIAVGHQSAARDDITTAGAQLTEFKLDIFGNAVLRVDYAGGVTLGTTFTVAGDGSGRTNPGNRVTSTKYDDDGHAIQVRDANQFSAGVNSSLINTSYDIYGRAAKQWRSVETAGGTQTAFQVTHYDALGRVSEIETPGNENLVDPGQPLLRNHKSTVYNAFGEVTATYLNQANGTVADPTAGQQLSYARYDQAGRAWLSNGSDGIDRVSLYDAMGNVTAQMVSTNASDTHQLQVLRSTAELGAVHYLQRTDMRYDLLGHMIDQSTPSQMNDAPTYVLQAKASGVGYDKVALAPDQPVPSSNLIFVGYKYEANKNFTIKYRALGSTGPFTAASPGLVADPQATSGGGDYLAFRADFIGTAYEYQVFAAPAGETAYQVGGGTISPAGTGNLGINRKIIELYLMINNRAPDADTLNQLVDKLNSGMTLEQLASYMLDTADGVAALQNGSLVFLTRLHDTVLNIAPNAAQVQGWKAQFDQGGDQRGATLLSILFDQGLRIVRRADALLNYLTINGGIDAAVSASLLAHADTAIDGAIAEGTAAAALEKQRAQVIRLFVAILGRMPNSSGLDFYVNGLRGGSSLAAIADSIFNSDEGKQLYPSLVPPPATDTAKQDVGTAIAGRLYGNLLGRPVTDEGNMTAFYLFGPAPVSLGTYAVMLTEATPQNSNNLQALSAPDFQAMRDKVAVSLAYLSLPLDNEDAAAHLAGSRAIISAINAASDRSTAVSQAMATLQAKATAAQAMAAQLQGAVTTTLEDRRLAITRLYIALLGRAPDRDGLAFYTGKMDAGLPLELFANGILNSQEATSNAALFPTGMSDTAFVNRVYNLAFGTVPDSGAMALAMLQLGSSSRGQVVLNIINSVVSGAYSAGPNGLALFNNKAAVGLAYALTMGNNSMANATTILGLVTATDTTAAVNFGLSVSGTAASANSTALAANIADAIALNASASAAQQSTASAATAVAAANAASAANPLAVATLRAAKYYAALLSHGRTGSGKPLDINEVATLARSLAAGADNYSGVQTILNSAEGKGLYPATVTGAEADALTTRMYQQVLGMPPSADKLAFWHDQYLTTPVNAMMTLMVNTMLDSTVDANDPQAEAIYSGRAAFLKDLNTSLSALTTVAATAITTATTATNNYTLANAPAKASTAATSAAAVQAAMDAAATNTSYVLGLSRLYVGILNRGPGAGQQPIDVGGINFYTRAMIQGYDLRTLAEQMVNSIEGTAMFAGLTDSAFVDQIFMQVLGRPAAAGNPWLTQLKTDTRGHVAADIIDSLVNHTQALASEYTSKANFDQKVATALQPLVSTAGPAATAAQQNIPATLSLLNTATAVMAQMSTALENAKNAPTGNEPSVTAAQQAALPALYYQNASPTMVADITRMLVAFNLPTDLAYVNARVADYVADPQYLIKLAALGAGVTATSMNDIRAFVIHLYQTVLHRDPEQKGLDFWTDGLPRAFPNDPAAAAYNFYLGCGNELDRVPLPPGDTDVSVRRDFGNEVKAATDADKLAAQTLINNYNAAVQAAADGHTQSIAQAQLAYDNAVADYNQKNYDWGQATTLAPVAQLTLAAVNSAIAIENKAVTADNDKSASLAADAMVAAAAASVGLPLTAVKADYDLVLANAKAFQPALALEVTQTAKQTDEATAATATAHVAASYTNLPPRSVQALQLTQMYQMLLARTPTQIELNEGLGLFANGRTLADQANALIAATPALSLPTLSNDAYANTILTNSSGAPVTVTIHLWSYQLSPMGTLDRGTLLVKLLTDVTRTNLSSGTLTFNTKVGTLLTTARNAALADATTPVVASYVTANAFVARDAVAKTDAAAKAAQPPAGAYATEMAQLYLLLLGRPPETAALASGIAQRAGGTPLLTIAQSIVASNEEQGRMPSTLSNADFVKALFQMGLGRAADATEQSTWTAKLAGTTPISRAQLAINLIADLYAYSGTDGVKLSAQTVFLGRVSEALGRPAIEALGTSHAIATLQGIQAQPVLTQYRTAPALAKNGGIIASQTPLSTRTQLTVDRWGNVLTVSDVRDPNWKISYAYNYNNQLISQTLNTLAGSTAKTSATAYDALGRQVSSTDFNGNTNTLRYNGNGNVALETHADNGTVSYTYDLFGDRMTVTTTRGVDKDTLQALPNLQTDYTYDHLGHLLSSTSGVVDSYIARVEYGGDGTHTRNLLMSQLSGALVQSYTYDALGRNVTRTDAANHTSTIRYDLDGNVIATVNEISAQTLNSYDAFHNRIATQDANGNGMRWNVDSHGRVLSSTSKAAGYSDIVTYYGYDGAGQKVSQTSDRSQSPTFSGVQNIRYVYANGLLTQVRDAGTGVTTTYTYDLAGNRLTEQQSYDSPASAPARVQNNTMTYDMQNRLASVSDDAYTLSYEYDANGNRTVVHTGYDAVVSTPGHWEYVSDPDHPDDPDVRTWIPGTQSNQHVSFDSYNSYDKMNRQTVVNGDLVNGAVVYGAQGHAITYDQAGNRLRDTFVGKQIYLNNGTYATRDGVTVESYSYDNAGRLSTIMRDGVLVNQRHYDQLGRVTESGILQGTLNSGLDTVTDAVGASSIRHIYAYGNSGLLLEQRDEHYNSNGGAGDLIQNIFFNDQEGRYDAAGNLLSYTISPKDTPPSRNYNYDVQYAYLDGQYKEVSKYLARSGTNISRYDVNGNRTSVVEQNTGKLLTSLWYGTEGYVQSKLEDGGGLHFSLIVNGQVLGEETRTRDNVLGSTYTGVSSPSLSAPPSTYSVQGASETLQSIAQNIWGDSKLWYLIADANALDSNSQLTAGQILNIPARVNTVHNDYATFKPYNATDAIGSTDPTLPAPSSGGGCGAVGKIIAVAIAVAVTIFTGNPALGNIAAQLFNMATGQQSGFDWKSAALSYVSYEIAGQLQLPGDGGTGSVMSWQPDLPAAIARAAIVNAATQTIGVVTGLQQGFSWQSVAASGIGAGVGTMVGSALNGTSLFDNAQLNNFAKAGITGFSTGLTTAVARGGKIAVLQVATDAFGNALGESVAGQLISSFGQEEPWLTQARNDLYGSERFAANNQVSNPIDSVQHDVLRLDAGAPGGYENQSDEYSFVSKYMDAHPDLEVNANSIDAVQTAFNRTKLTEAQLFAEAEGQGPLTAQWAEVAMQAMNSPIADGIMQDSSSGRGTDLYTPTRSVIGDAYRFSLSQAADPSNSWDVRAGYGASALITAIPGMFNDMASGALNSVNDLYSGSNVMAEGWATSNPYRFSAGLMRTSGGLLNFAGALGALNGGMVANQAVGEYGANSRSISEISVEYSSQGSGKISHASMTGNVDGVPTNLGNMKYVYEESGSSKIVSVNMYEINPEFRGQGLSTKLFSDVQNYHQANMFEGLAGFENSSILSRTGSIGSTPWAKSMNRIGFDTTYDPYMGMMTSVKRTGQ